MKNVHLLKVKYLGPTTFKGSRVKIISERFKQSIILNYDYRFNSEIEIAINYLELNGFEVIGKNDKYIVSSTFKGLKD